MPPPNPPTRPAVVSLVPAVRQNLIIASFENNSIPPFKNDSTIFGCNQISNAVTNIVSVSLPESLTKMPSDRPSCQHTINIKWHYDIDIIQRNTLLCMTPNASNVLCCLYVPMWVFHTSKGNPRVAASRHCNAPPTTKSLEFVDFAGAMKLQSSRMPPDINNRAPQAIYCKCTVGLRSANNKKKRMTYCRVHRSVTLGSVHVIDCTFSELYSATLLPTARFFTKKHKARNFQLREFGSLDWVHKRIIDVPIVFGA